MYNIVTLEGGDIHMSVSYKKLFDIMEDRGLKKYWLRQNGINPKVVDALKNNRNVNVSTLLDLCRLLNCQPGDLLEYIPDDPENISTSIK